MKQLGNGRRVTLEDIAAETGYTINTVSRALKNKPDIARATCESIQQVADRMGYVRNYMASSLRSGRSRTLAAIVGGMSNPFYAVMVDAIHDIAEEINYTVLVMCSRDNIDQELKAVVSAISRQVDGVILYPCRDSARSLKLLRDAGLPFVLASRRLEDAEADSVVCDEEQGGYLAAKHLIEAGHRKLAFVYGFDVVYSSARRIAGFRRGAAECGLCEDDLELFHNTGDEAIRVKLRDWKERGVTGLFTFCDMEAWQLISVIQSCGWDVPRDFGVVGFDDIQSSLGFPMPLCTIDGQMLKVTRGAMSLLHERIRGDQSEPKHLEYPVELLCRGSCGAR